MIGTTPTHIFYLPLDPALLKRIKNTYAQDGKGTLEKYETDCTINGKELRLELSQEDTFKFDERSIVDIQIRVLTNEGKAPKTPVYHIRPDECLDTEVLV